jgi:hypothetical protein
VVTVNTDSEPNSLVDKRKRRTPKRTSTHSRNTSGMTATVTPDDASGGLETCVRLSCVVCVAAASIQSSRHI